MMIKENTPQSRPNDGYKEFERKVFEEFGILVDNNTKLFLTDASNLWDIYLDNLPEGRDYYNCNACKHFIERFGNLAAVNVNGELVSVLWNIEVPDFFKESVRKMNDAVKNAKIKRQFIAEQRVLGIPKTGEWTHLNIKVPQSIVNTSRLHTANQLMAEKSEEYRMLLNALKDFEIETIQQAINLLETETIYRGDKCLAIAKWFKEIKEVVDNCENSKQKQNFMWLAVASAPTGFAHIRSSMIGTLLEDIQNGLSYTSVVRRFTEKMDPSNYMRSQSAPTEGAILEAEKIVEKLGIADSLVRRYATLEEIPEFLWKPSNINKKVEKATKGVFGNITPKNKVVTSQIDTNLPITVMTWDKFKRTLLPNALSIEAKVENQNRLMALVTAFNEDAENILQWNNTFSWYYHGGIDAEMKRRIENAGGQYENNVIRCSLIWEGFTDLDLHCITPNGSEIYFGNKRSNDGYLDIDMNGGGHRDNHPVENIRWTSTAPIGRYKFYVHNYQTRGNSIIPYKVELEVNGQIYSYNGESHRTNSNDKVFEFDYLSDGSIRMISTSNSVNTTFVDDWNINEGFNKVNLITTSPNLWGDNEFTNAGNHVFFILDKCKDLSEGKGRGFFNEMLKSELRQIRKTLEAYTATTPIENIENASACGLGFNSDSEWNLILRVKTNESTRLVKIDRWD